MPEKNKSIKIQDYLKATLFVPVYSDYSVEVELFHSLLVPLLPVSSISDFQSICQLNAIE